MLSCKPARGALFTGGGEENTSLPSAILKNVIFSKFFFNVRGEHLAELLSQAVFRASFMSAHKEAEQILCLGISFFQVDFNVLFRFISIHHFTPMIIMGSCHGF